MEQILDQKIIEYILVFLGLLLICVSLLKYSSGEEEEVWFPNHLLPKRNDSSNYSNDVLIQCYDTRKHLIGYYDFAEERWRCINYQDIPKNFKWRYLTIEME